MPDPQVECAACKVIINGLLGALAVSLEEVLTTQELRGTLTDKEANDLLQQMLDLDLAQYSGATTSDATDTAAVPVAPRPRGLAGIVKQLVDRGVVGGEVWEILRAPSP